jgi:hypothetical protein
MEDLTVEATKSTPSVFLDASRGLLEIKGKSYPENASKFYLPILDTVRCFLESTSPALFRVTLEIIYLNSSSSKALLNLLDMLDRAAKTGREVVITWRYHEEDLTSLECGDEFKDELESAVFNLVKITER